MITAYFQVLFGAVICAGCIACFLMAPDEKEEKAGPVQFVSVEDGEGHHGIIRLALPLFDKVKTHLTVPSKYLIAKGVRS